MTTTLAPFSIPDSEVLRDLQAPTEPNVTVVLSQKTSWFHPPECVCGRDASALVTWWSDNELHNPDGVDVLSQEHPKHVCRFCAGSVVTDAVSDPMLDRKAGVTVEVSYWWLVQHRAGGVL